MNSSAELLSQFPQKRAELYLQAMNLRLGCRFDEALGVLERLQQLHPGYSRLYEERGHCYAALNNAPQAIDAFWQAVNINAALPASWQMLHTLYQGIGDEESAARIADRLATLRNLPPEIIQAGSWFADGEFVHAERVLRIYLAQHGEHIEAMRLLGRVCIARGLRDDAELLLEAVVQRAEHTSGSTERPASGWVTMSPGSACTVGCWAMHSRDGNPQSCTCGSRSP
jgi:tetratricopeptide (TPR) repeat protein